MSTGIQRTPIQRKDLPEGSLPGIDFESYLYAWAMYIRGQQDYGRDLDQAAVTMHIRSRGVTVSDLVSNFGTRPETRGMWMQYDANLDGEVHPINIVGPAITTNKNACLQSNSETEIRSANASALHKQIAMRWQRVADYFERIGWDEEKRGFIFDDVQKGGTTLVESVLVEKESAIVPRVNQAKSGLALLSCAACGKTGMMHTDMPKSAPQEAAGPGQPTKPLQSGEDADTDNDDDSQAISESIATKMQCPGCGEEADAVITPLAGLELGEDEVPVYDIDDNLIPNFNFVMDPYGARIGGIKTAGWCQVHHLRDLMYMTTHYPHMQFSGPARWSFQSRCAYALATSRYSYINLQPRPAMWGYGHERYEEQAIYLHEESYASYRSPADYEFVNAKGEKTFKIKQGQTIQEAQKAMYGENPKGFKFLWHEDRLLDIPSIEAEEVNFRHRFSDVHWNRESGSYRSAPNYSLVYIQDDLTLINTLDHNIDARNAFNPVYYNSTVFERDDFSKEFIPSSKQALLDPDNFDVRKHIAQLPVPTSNPKLMERLQFLWGIKDSVSLVTPAMRGESQGSSPYAAQRQQLEQSYGNLTSVLKSFAQCKCDTFRNKARLAKKKWTLEQFQDVGSMWGEIWTEEDVEEMCDIDFDRDLIVTYRQGSEMPATPMGQEMKFFGALQQLMPFIQAMPGIIGQDKMNQILQKIDEFGEFDFDLTGLEVNELIAQKRYNDLAKLCEEYQGLPPQAVEAMKQQVVGMEPAPPELMQQAIAAAQAAPDDPQVLAQAQKAADGTPITAMDVLTEQIFAASGIRFSQYEDLAQQTAFFIEMLRAEIGKTKPNFVLIEMLEVVLGLLGQAQDKSQQEAMAKDPQVQMAQAQQEAEAKQADAQNQIEAAKIQTEQAKIQSDNQNQAADREVEMQKQQGQLVHGLLTQAADQDHQTESQERTIEAQQEAAKEAAKNAPAPTKK